ncbi:MAG: alpha-ribazole phosphatase [Chloroflexi bacterium]|nr:alpha-ribazole phosphatase [Chloroflexota bacterium]
MTRLLLVRHGDTRLNSGERFWGRTDVELSSAGLRQAERLGERLASHRIDAVYASNLVRAKVTAAAIASAHNLEMTTCPELNEIDFGLVEGLTYNEISERFPDLVKLWANWDIKTNFPEGESIEEFSSRVVRFGSRLEKHTPEETVLVVAHSGTVRLLLCHLLGLELHHWRQMRIGFASLSILETHRNGGVLTLLNDVSHLDSLQTG